MRVTVLYFGVLKDLAAAEQDALELPEGETVAGLVHHLRESASKQSEVWSSLAVAVNREYAVADTVLRDGDEVALLPPVSGGLDVKGNRDE
jgi:molybdopterin converting factor subunit 1